MTQPTGLDEGAHLLHCNQGEYLGACKYGDATTCPSLLNILFPPITQRLTPERLAGYREWAANEEVRGYQDMGLLLNELDAVTAERDAAVALNQYLHEERKVAVEHWNHYEEQVTMLREALRDLPGYFADERASYIRNYSFGREVSELDRHAVGFAMKKAYEFVVRATAEKEN